MRLTTLAVASIVAVSTAALAQITTPETEQKVPAAGQSPLGNDVAAADSADPSASRAEDSAPSPDATPNADAPSANKVAPAAAPTEQKPGARRPRR